MGIARTLKGVSSIILVHRVVVKGPENLDEKGMAKAEEKEKEVEKEKGKAKGAEEETGVKVERPLLYKRKGSSLMEINLQVVRQ